MSKEYSMSPAELLKTPVSRIWVLLEEILDEEKHLLKDVYGNIGIVEEEEFGEDWDEKTSPPDWWIRKQEREKHMWNKDGK